MYMGLSYGNKAVGEEGLEPSWIAPHGPKPCACTSSATRPKVTLLRSRARTSYH